MNAPDADADTEEEEDDDAVEDEVEAMSDAASAGQMMSESWPCSPSCGWVWVWSVGAGRREKGGSATRSAKTLHVSERVRKRWKRRSSDM